MKVTLQTHGYVKKKTASSQLGVRQWIAVVQAGAEKFAHFIQVLFSCRQTYKNQVLLGTFFFRGGGQLLTGGCQADRGTRTP